MKGKTKILLAALALTTLCLTLIGMHEYKRVNKSLNDSKEDFRTNTTDLLTEFEQHETRAQSLYVGKIIAITGKIKTLEKDEKGYFTIVLAPDASNSSIRCSMDTIESQNLANLLPSTNISIKGFVLGYNADVTGILGSDILLNRCILLK